MTITTQEAENHQAPSPIRMRRYGADDACDLYKEAVGESTIKYEKLALAAQNARDALAIPIGNQGVKDKGVEDPLGIDKVDYLHRIIEHNDAQQAYLKVTDLIGKGRHRKAGEVARKLVASGADYLLSVQKTQVRIAAEDYGPSVNEVLTETGRTISGKFEAVKESVADSYAAALVENAAYGAMEIAKNPRSAPEVLKGAVRGARDILREDVGSLVEQGTQIVKRGISGLKEAYDGRVARKEAEKALAEATTRNVDAPITVDEILARNITGVNIDQHYREIVPRVEIEHRDSLFDEIRIGHALDDFGWEEVAYSLEPTQENAAGRSRDVVWKFGAGLEMNNPGSEGETRKLSTTPLYTSNENTPRGVAGVEVRNPLSEKEIGKLILAMDKSNVTDDRNPYLRESTWEEDQAHVAAWLAKKA